MIADVMWFCTPVTQKARKVRRHHLRSCLLSDQVTCPAGRPISLPEASLHLPMRREFLAVFLDLPHGGGDQVPLPADILDVLVGVVLSVRIHREVTKLPGELFHARDLIPHLTLGAVEDILEVPPTLGYVGMDLSGDRRIPTRLSCLEPQPRVRTDVYDFLHQWNTPCPHQCDAAGQSCRTRANTSESTLVWRCR